jgi:hypothetical protein
MITIKQADFDNIHKDYKSTWNGKRAVFAGCLMKDGGTKMAVEGQDFEIIPAPVKAKKHRYKAV